MSAFYTYHVVFISPDTKETHVLLEDGRVFPNDLKLNRALWENWRDEVSRDDITTFVHGVHNDSTAGCASATLRSSDFGWIWSKPRAELVRVF